MEDRIRRHCAELNRCNQRGGRMLSLLDLLDAATLDLDLAAYLMARITTGASLLVGARPGGAGKTTVMAALLNLMPPDVELRAATAPLLRTLQNQTTSDRCCLICHEIGPGAWFAYLWDADLRRYCSFHDRGFRLATNLHADDLDEAREQICSENGVPERHFNQFDLALFLRVRGGMRRIDKVYVSDRLSPHRLIYDDRAALFRQDITHADPWREQCRIFLENLRPTTTRTIEDIREHVTAFLDKKVTDETMLPPKK